MKKPLSTFFSFFLVFSGISQDIIITEIMYNPPESGIDSLEFVEIYNNGSTTINLNNYTLSPGAGVGGGMNHTFGTINFAPGQYLVIAEDSAAVANTFGYSAIQANGSSSLTNTGKSVVIKNDLGAVQDSVRYNPSLPWPIAGNGQGPSITLCDYTSDNNQGTNWIASANPTGVMINTFSVYASLGTSDTVACAIVPQLSFSGTGITVFENTGGTLTVSVNIVNEDANQTTVDVMIGGSSTAGTGDFTFTSQTLTFPANSSANQTFTVTITDDLIAETPPVEHLILELTNPTNNGVIGTNSTYDITIIDDDGAGATPCSELFFSEYVEGSSTNKALEIYNPTFQVIDLSNYSVRRYSNGNATPNSSLTLSGSLVPGEVYVIGNSSATVASWITNAADISSAVTNFNGDDAIELFSILNNTVIDVIGEVGVDPGSSWPVGAGSTKDFTLVRKPSVDGGTTIWAGLGNTQWSVLPTNDSTNLGQHNTTACSSSIPLTAYPLFPNTTCHGEAVIFTHTSYGGDGPYMIDWDFGNANGDTGNIATETYNFAGNYTVTLTITDNLGAVDDSVFTITVNLPPVAGFSIPDTICPGDVVAMTTTSVVPMSDYSYTYPTALTEVTLNSNTGNGTFTSNTPGAYSITQTVIDTNGCSAQDVQGILVNSGGDASFILLSDLCEGDTLYLSHPDINGTWSGTGVMDQTNGLGYFFTASLGMFDISYTVGGVCPDIFTDTVEIFNSPTASFSYSITNTTIDFMNTSTGGTSYFWDFGDGNTSTSLVPSHTYSDTGTYIVCFEVTNSRGCTDSICQSVLVEDQSVGIGENDRNAIQIYPNPNNGNFNLKIGIITAEITINNILGETIYSTKATGMTEITIPNLSSGTYFVTIDSSQDLVTQKMIISE